MTPKNFKTHEEYLQWYRDYRAKNKERIAEIRKRNVLKRGKPWDERNKLARYAQYILNQAVVSGKVSREACCVCKTEINVQAHHDDYYKPLQVLWLCGVHHKARHKLLGKVKGTI